MSKRRSHDSRQGGVVLVVVLILLVIMALVGVAMLRGTLMEEGMSGGMMDRGLSFQAAEAALREGEALAATKPAVTADACADGRCGIRNPESTPVWEVAAHWAAAPETTVDLGGLTAKSKYLVELIADNVPRTGSCTTGEDVSPEAACAGTESRYRITARSEAQGRSEVMLQSVYAVP